ncbi:MAG: FAD-dependent oxidoreductase, partial [Acidobacteria bacterium]|nr:FAD-dependent oxidoreductase [Acidobacteriota bacterium]
MSEIFEVTIPDMGDFDSVDVVEVLVAAGDPVSEDQSLITLESDKASMEVPAPRGGTVHELRVQPGDKVSQGQVILTLEIGGEGAGEAQAQKAERPEASEPRSSREQKTESKGTDAAKPSTAAADPADGSRHAEVLVLGSGPGGYSAAFRAADLGKKVVLVERHAKLGGVCLNVGCIPSKALLHAAEVIAEARGFAGHGIAFGEPKIDLDALRSWKDSVVGRLNSGLDGLAKRRSVEVIHGEGRFVGPHRLRITPTADTGGERGGETFDLRFDHAIIAAGSRVVELPMIPKGDERIFDSTGALELRRIPKRLLVIGGGIIG